MKKYVKHKHPTDENLFWCSYHKEYHQREEFSRYSANPNGLAYICRLANKICHYKSMSKRENKETLVEVK